MLRILFQGTVLGCAAVAALAFAAQFKWGGGRFDSPVVESAASCPISFKSEGSTTVAPITRASEAPFESFWTAGGGVTDAQLAAIGSGAGINNLIAGTT